MKNNLFETRLHRGSSPAFHETDNRVDSSAISLASNGQGREHAPSAQLVMPFVIERNQASHSKDDSRSDKEDVSRWQDDGGESGEDV